MPFPIFNILKKGGTEPDFPVTLNPVIYLDGQDPSVFTGTNPVTKWADKSGNGNDFDVIKNTPQYTTKDGYGCVHLNYLDTIGCVGAAVNQRAHTIFQIFVDAYSTSAKTLTLSAAEPNTSLGAGYGMHYTESSANYRIESPFGNTYTPSWSRNLTDRTLWSSRFQEGSLPTRSVTIQQHNSTVYTNNSSNSVRYGQYGDGWSIGGHRTPQARDLYFMELIVYDGFMSNPNNTAVINWLKNKYNFI